MFVQHLFHREVGWDIESGISTEGENERGCGVRDGVAGVEVGDPLSKGHYVTALTLAAAVVFRDLAHC